MKQQVIRITESDLRNIITDAVNNILKESKESENQESWKQIDRKYRPSRRRYNPDDLADNTRPKRKNWEEDYDKADAERKQQKKKLKEGYNYRNPFTRIIAAMKQAGKTPEEIKAKLEELDAQNLAIRDINRDIAQERMADRIPLTGDEESDYRIRRYNDSRDEFHKPINRDIFKRY